MPIVLCKNTLFFGSKEGVEVATAYYTLIEICKLKGLAPQWIPNACFPPTNDRK